MGVMACIRFWHQGTKVNNKESESCLSCTWHAYWCLSMPLANISKIFQIVKKLWPAQKFGLEIHLRVVTGKQPVSVVILAWDTPT